MPLFDPDDPEDDDGPGAVRSLETLAASSYLGFLEEECAAYVTMANIDSPVWNPVRERLLEALARHIDACLSSATRKASGLLRGRLAAVLVGGAFPSAHHRNAYVPQERGMPPRGGGLDDDEEEAEQVSNELEQVKYFGRRCCSPCCTGAFIVEVMLAVITNADVDELEFKSDLKSVIYRKKAVKQFLFFDINSLVIHYMRRLELLKKDELPSLRRLVFHAGQLGSVDSQLVHEGILKSSVELRRYHDFPGRFSGRCHAGSRAGTDSLMATLSELFDRREGYFGNLVEIQLTQECINTRMSVYGRGARSGHAVVEIMAGIGRACPRLRILNLAEVSSLSPECLIYLFYRDPFFALHKYTYLPRYAETGRLVSHGHLSAHVANSGGGQQPAKHDGVRYCPWCLDPAVKRRCKLRRGCDLDVSETLHVVDDRLFDYVERDCGDDRAAAAGNYLAYCVKITDLIRAFDDDVFELDREKLDGSKREAIETVGVGGHSDDDEADDECSYPWQGDNVSYKRRKRFFPVKSSLCDTLEKLLLPLDIADAKTWVIPLFLYAAPRLTSLGDAYVCDGIRLCRELSIGSGMEERLRSLNLEEASVCLEDFTSFRVKERVVKSLKSLVSKRSVWNTFASSNSLQQQQQRPMPFSLNTWVNHQLTGETPLDLPDVQGITERWARQIECLVTSCPKLKHLKISIQALILPTTGGLACKAIWRPLADRAHLLRSLCASNSCWADVLGLLQSVGPKIRCLSLMLNSPKSMREDDISSTDYVNTVPFLCPNLEELYLGYKQGGRPHSLCENDAYDSEENFARVTRFRATGSITLEAFAYLWKRAKTLQEMRISGHVVPNPSSTMSPEVTLTRDRVLSLFESNPMSRIRILDVNLTLGSIAVATALLEALPYDAEYIATLNVKVSIPESLEGENFGDLVSSVLKRMADFKEDCLKRQGKVVWNWKREGILTILLQQQMLLSVSDLIDP